MIRDLGKEGQGCEDRKCNSHEKEEGFHHEGTPSLFGATLNSDGNERVDWAFSTLLGHLFIHRCI
jgi:hypothetical protein